MPTDTLYGLCARADDREAVTRVYELKSRSADKPVSTLIHDMSALADFGVSVSLWQRQYLENVWPGPTTIVFAINDTGRFQYLQREAGGLSFRVPGDTALRAFLEKSGPIVAPSANPEGETPATTVDEALAYFGDRVPFYVDGGERSGPPSDVVDLTGDAPSYIRSAASKNESHSQ